MGSLRVLQAVATSILLVLLCGQVYPVSSAHLQGRATSAVLSPAVNSKRAVLGTLMKKLKASSDVEFQQAIGTIDAKAALSSDMNEMMFRSVLKSASEHFGLKNVCYNHVKCLEPLREAIGSVVSANLELDAAEDLGNGGAGGITTASPDVQQAKSKALASLMQQLHDQSEEDFKKVAGDVSVADATSDGMSATVFAKILAQGKAFFKLSCENDWKCLSALESKVNEAIGEVLKGMEKQESLGSPEGDKSKLPDDVKETVAKVGQRIRQERASKARPNLIQTTNAPDVPVDTKPAEATKPEAAKLDAPIQHHTTPEIALTTEDEGDVDDDDAASASNKAVGVDNEVVDLRGRQAVEEAIERLYKSLNFTIRQLRQFENDAATAKDYKSAARFQNQKRALLGLVDRYFKNRVKCNPMSTCSIEALQALYEEIVAAIKEAKKLFASSNVPISSGNPLVALLKVYEAKWDDPKTTEQQKSSLVFIMEQLRKGIDLHTALEDTVSRRQWHRASILQEYLHNAEHALIAKLKAFYGVSQNSTDIYGPHGEKLPEVSVESILQAISADRVPFRDAKPPAKA